MQNMKEAGCPLAHIPERSVTETANVTEPDIYQSAGLALDLLGLHDLRWVSHAWFVCHHWPDGLDPELRQYFRDALGKLQLCHTGDVVDPSIDKCRSALLRVAAFGQGNLDAGPSSAACGPQHETRPPRSSLRSGPHAVRPPVPERHRQPEHGEAERNQEPESSEPQQPLPTLGETPR